MEETAVRYSSALFDQGIISTTETTWWGLPVPIVGCDILASDEGQSSDCTVTYMLFQLVLQTRADS